MEGVKTRTSFGFAVFTDHRDISQSHLDAVADSLLVMSKWLQEVFPTDRGLFNERTTNIIVIKCLVSLTDVNHLVSSGHAGLENSFLVVVMSMFSPS